MAEILGVDLYPKKEAEKGKKGGKKKRKSKGGPDAEAVQDLCRRLEEYRKKKDEKSTSQGQLNSKVVVPEKTKKSEKFRIDSSYLTTRSGLKGKGLPSNNVRCRSRSPRSPIPGLISPVVIAFHLPLPPPPFLRPGPEPVELMEPLLV